MSALEETRSKLQELEAEAAAEERKQLTERLRLVREDLRKGRQRYDELAVTIKSQREDRANAQAAINRAADAVTEHLQERPAVAVHLPDDEEVQRWRRAHTRLEARRDALIDERNQLPDPEPLVDEAIAYEGLDGRIASLQYAEANLLRKLEGPRAGFGVSGVR